MVRRGKNKKAGFGTDGTQQLMSEKLSGFAWKSLAERFQGQIRPPQLSPVARE
jgi:hypothetical protein